LEVLFMYFQQIFEPKLAHNAYLIGCQESKEAIIIDPQRDIDRYIKIAEKSNLNIVAAADTHIHADYLSGTREFAELGDVKIYASDEGSEEWKFRWLINSKYEHQLLRHGDTFRVGQVKFEVVFTPGHTPEHISYLVFDVTDRSDTPLGILSGDFVFVGDVGRPDLLEVAAGYEGVMKPAAKELHSSLKKFKELPEFLQVWPGHGAGSACGKALGAVPLSTVGYELRFNPSLKASSTLDGFVAFILEGQPEPPPYFSRMKRENRNGPVILNSLPDPAELSAGRIPELAAKTDIAVVDTRPWDEFRTGHLRGSLAMPLNKTFPTNAGSYVSPNTPIYLIVEKHNLEEAVRDLIRIGLDEIAGYVTSDTLKKYHDDGGKIDTTEQIEINEMKRRLKANNAFLLDVRGATEFSAGHIDGAFNIAHTQLTLRMKEIPATKQILVSCRTGERSGYASALLEKSGYDVAHVAGGLAAWEAAGETLVAA
jgi:hydroxyacylglutathione hydrolase